MRGRTKLISLAAMLTVIFVSSVVYSSGILNVRSLSLFSTPIFPDQTPVISVSPSAIIKDYLDDPGYAAGDFVEVNVTISDATDIFSYQINVTWTTSMLNFSSLVSYGDFLNDTLSAYGTSRIEPTVAVNHTEGWVSIAETILGDVSGESGAGVLFTMEFEILDYGNATIDISPGGELPTMLLDSTGAEVGYTTASGYFRNVLFGDANLDRIIDVFDILKVKNHRSGPPPGPGGYLREADINDDTSIDVFDILIVKANLGRFVP